MAGGLRNHFCGFQLMRWLTRMAACAAVAPRIVLLLAVLFTASLLSFSLRAQNYSDEGTAYAACMAYIGQYVSARPNTTRSPRCPHRVQTTQGIFEGQSQYLLPDNVTWAWSPKHGTFAYPITKKCSTRTNYNGSYPNGNIKPRSGSLSCDLGCETIWTDNPDGSVNGQALGKTCTGDDYDSDDDCAKAVPGGGYYHNRGIGVCEPPDPSCKGGGKANSLGKCEPEPCPSGTVQQQDGTCKKAANECPAGQVRSPDGKCLPGDGQCAAGEVRGPDGTCKKDGDGDGKPDEPGANESFSGGDDCNIPPSCSGSPIMCGQARIQWRIDCNTRRNRNIAGGLCSAMPVCTGDKCDAMEYAALLMQWRSACALEKMASSTGNGGGDGADVKAIRDALTGTGGSVTTAPDRPSSDVWSPRSGTPVKPDTGGYGWGRSCPQPPSFEVFGNVIQINTAPLCNWLILGSYFVMGLAALASLRIIATRDA
ncbi:virulence factor TspB C-terminal domain-related protein [Stenotrophomonas maltophilia]|uniref:virulence factor TspB C-terminal domain-related protein n=1 Tax=Stenotrophomonas maltophilia TaxID=40324 RepID=UPI0015DEF42A|nr:virulence factor TspB C-terminal domain-related protein [Stenotrophomonas maltophilia]